MPKEAARLGSPPPMWGKVASASVNSTLPRITPTHVGKSLFQRIEKILLEDHPHPCGEKLLAVNLAQICVGSPPPMWGKAIEIKGVCDKERITPTHVEKSRGEVER